MSVNLDALQTDSQMYVPSAEPSPPSDRDAQISGVACAQLALPSPSPSSAGTPATPASSTSGRESSVSGSSGSSPSKKRPSPVNLPDTAEKPKKRKLQIDVRSGYSLPDKWRETESGSASYLPSGGAWPQTPPAAARASEQPDFPSPPKFSARLPAALAAPPAWRSSSHSGAHFPAAASALSLPRASAAPAGLSLDVSAQVDPEALLDDLPNLGLTAVDTGGEESELAVVPLDDAPAELVLLTWASSLRMKFEDVSTLIEFVHAQGLTEIRKVASGNYGSVLEAMAGSHPVVVKVFKNPKEIQQDRGNFLFQGQNLDPRFARTRDFCVKEGCLVAIVMDKASGGTLRSLMDEDIAPRDFFTIAKETAEGLCWLKTQNIIHRDLQPRNILWNPETRKVKIIDYDAAVVGIATGRVGEQGYTAPEMDIPDHPGASIATYDCRADAYSFGEVLRKMEHCVDWSQYPAGQGAAKQAQVLKIIERLQKGKEERLSIEEALVQLQEVSLPPVTAASGT